MYAAGKTACSQIHNVDRQPSQIVFRRSRSPASSCTLCFSPHPEHQAHASSNPIVSTTQPSLSSKHPSQWPPPYPAFSPTLRKLQPRRFPTPVSFVHSPSEHSVYPCSLGLSTWSIGSSAAPRRPSTPGMSRGLVFARSCFLVASRIWRRSARASVLSLRVFGPNR